jgi:UDPglucose 6-dehydrogenase
MIGFIGLSHLGLNYSLATAAKGFEVVCYDPDAALVGRLREGVIPIEEPGFRELFSEHRPRLRFTSDSAEMGNCELVFYALDVSTNERNESDLVPCPR